jgi:mono/diheme cytochrome c family protein
MSFKLSLILLNVIAIGVTLSVIARHVFSKERNPEPEPANLTPFLEDDALEGRRLERVLGWSLLMSAVMIIALVGYFLWEPFRTADAEDQFLERSIERGAVLFANDSSPVYESEFSLLCADCHGPDGTGGVAPFTLQPEADECQRKKSKNNFEVPECLPVLVQWSAPDLTRAPLIYSRAQLIEIITYGRPGTPMPPWGVKSGLGPKNTQSIADLVNYLDSIAMTSEEAMKQSTEKIDEYRQEARDRVDNGKTGPDRAGLQVDVDEAAAALAAAQADPATSEADLTRLSGDLERLEQELVLAIAYRDDVETLSDGAVLFRLNCARCHTKGWSFFQNDPTNVDLPPLPPQGSGAYGPNLTGGAVLLQFPGQAGRVQQIAWVTDGVDKNGSYGIRGISSGRMPHFGKVLSKEQIEQIVDYERSLSGEGAEAS